ncbi:phytosulfokin receptor 1 [Wolffia australiana]
MERKKPPLIVALILLMFAVGFACDSGDLKALQEFSRQLDSGAIEGWRFDQTSLPVDCCGWRGITCEDSSLSSSTSNSSRRVVGLDLSGRRIKGNLSVSVASLDGLRRLNLSQNSFGGAVPAEIFRLQRLVQLDLSANEFSGGLPGDSSLPSIQVFNLSFNEFSGSHPVLRESKNLIAYDIGFNSFSGVIDASICTISTEIRVLRFTRNQFSGPFPADLAECKSLSELRLDANVLSGDLSRLGDLSSSLVQLDISSNEFSGGLPDVFDRLKNLRYFAAAKNKFSGAPPPSLSALSSIQVLNLRMNSFSGEINFNFSGMPRLCFLDLGSNLFRGEIPAEISSCQDLRTLNLARNSLSGEIPRSFSGLSSLTSLSLSNNSFTNIASALETLQQCPSLTNLVLTRNFEGETLPSAGVQGFKNLTFLAVANCRLSGEIPPWLSGCPKLRLLDVSWNRLHGGIPAFFGELDLLFYLDLSNNSLTGPIPGSLARMQSLVSRGTASFSDAPSADFPFFSRTNISAPGLQYNQVTGFKPSLLLSDNFLSGSIPPELGGLRNLHVLDLAKNNLTGGIPPELSNMEKLETLDLSHNQLTGEIPPSLTKLTFLAKFSVADNNLIGRIPRGTQFDSFPYDSFAGNRGLCGVQYEKCPAEPSAVPGRSRRSKGSVAAMAAGIAAGAVCASACLVLVLFRARSKRVRDPSEEAAAAAGSGDEDAAPAPKESKIVLLFRNNSREGKGLTVEDVLRSTNNFDQANIIGCGGFGLVFKATLPDGTKVAIKRLSGDYGQMDREFQAEIETLSRAQHRNLVLLQGYCKIGKDRLLIYSFMENGSLDYWLHENPDGGAALDWPTRLRIARGAARGLAYLHQACEPHILHRDIKSSNILLDDGFEAHLADFGLARLILPYDTHVTTDLVGTLGYIPPEYGQSSVATFKGDVYSFGVVLLELLTGRRPVDMCRPKGARDLVSWVLQLTKDRRDVEVFDPVVYNKARHKQLVRLLEIACLCLSESPRLRPLTQQIVPWLDSLPPEDDLA